MLTEADLATAEASPDIGHLVDVSIPGAPLVLCFGFVDWHAPPRFDFARRLMRLEQRSRRAIGRILLRDPANLWYQHGIPGLGHDVDESVAALQDLINRLQPSSVAAIGQSMGGYAALLYGTLLGVDRILAFGPLSHLDSDRARAEGDLRWVA